MKKNYTEPYIDIYSLQHNQFALNEPSGFDYEGANLGENDDSTGRW